MKIFVDGEVFALPEGAEADGKKGIYESVRLAAIKDGRVITNVIVDGAELAEPDLFLEIAGGIEARFETQAVRVLVGESLAEGTKYMPTLIAGLETIATKFEKGENKDAGDMFGQAAEGVNWLFGVFERCCGLLGVTAETLKTGNFAEDSEHIKDVLNEMTASMEAGEDLKLAFLIRDKLIPVIERFSKYWEEVSNVRHAPLQ